MGKRIRERRAVQAERAMQRSNLATLSRAIVLICFGPKIFVLSRQPPVTDHVPARRPRSNLIDGVGDGLPAWHRLIFGVAPHMHTLEERDATIAETECADNRPNYSQNNLSLVHHSLAHLSRHVNTGPGTCGRHPSHPARRPPVLVRGKKSPARQL